MLILDLALSLQSGNGSCTPWMFSALESLAPGAGPCTGDPYLGWGWGRNLSPSPGAIGVGRSREGLPAHIHPKLTAALPPRHARALPCPLMPWPLGPSLEMHGLHGAPRCPNCLPAPLCAQHCKFCGLFPAALRGVCADPEAQSPAARSRPADPSSASLATGLPLSLSKSCSGGG